MWNVPSKNTHGGVIIVNKNYVKGANFEREIKKGYEKLDYLVFRTAGSHSPADLIAFPIIGNWFRNKEQGYVPILIQCKATERNVTKKECEDLKLIAIKYGLKAILVCKRDTKIGVNTIVIYDGE